MARKSILSIFSLNGGSGGGGGGASTWEELTNKPFEGLGSTVKKSGTDLEVNKISEITDDEDKIPNAKAVYEYIASGNFGNPRHISPDTISNINYIADTGFYYIEDGIEGAPVMGKGGYLIVVRKTTETKQQYYQDYTQLFYCMEDSTWYSRQLKNNTWVNWTKVLKESDLPDLSDYYTKTETNTLLSSKATAINNGVISTFDTRTDLLNSLVTVANKAITTGWYGTFNTASENPNGASGGGARFYHTINVANVTLTNNKLNCFATIIATLRATTQMYICTGTETEGVWTWGDWEKISNDCLYKIYVDREAFRTATYISGKQTSRSIMGYFSTQAENPMGLSNRWFMTCYARDNGNAVIVAQSAEKMNGMTWTCVKSGGTWGIWERTRTIVDTTYTADSLAALYNAFNNGIYEFTDMKFTTGSPTGSAGQSFHVILYRFGNYCTMEAEFGPDGRVWRCYRVSGTTFSNWQLQDLSTKIGMVNNTLGSPLKYNDRTALVTAWYAENKLSGVWYGCFDTASENPHNSTAWTDRYIMFINIVNSNNYATMIAMNRGDNNGDIYICSGAVTNNVYVWSGWKRVRTDDTRQISGTDVPSGSSPDLLFTLCGLNSAGTCELYCTAMGNLTPAPTTSYGYVKLQHAFNANYRRIEFTPAQANAATYALTKVNGTWATAWQKITSN